MSEAADIRDLARVILDERKKPRTTLLQGEVAATPGGGVISVYISGEIDATDGIRYLASYTPAVNDVVWMIKSGATVIVLGELA